MYPTNGAVAQLGERHNGIVEAVGSTPISSTILKLKRPLSERIRPGLGGLFNFGILEVLLELPHSLEYK